MSQQNVYDKPLKLCSLDPLTGYRRNGYCEVDESDAGTHTVCAVMTDDFLTYTKRMGNNLTDASREHSFPGLVDGDKWCLCALRWEQARQAGKAPPVILDATHRKTLQYTSLDALRGQLAGVI
jgi:uncharacterized protein (DUF2237 family)